MDVDARGHHVVFMKINEVVFNCFLRRSITAD